MSYIRQERRARATGSTIQVADLAHPDSEFEPDDGYRWATICCTHSRLCVHPTLRLAIAHAADPGGWCEDCRTDAPWRVCPSCGGRAPWADDAYVCTSCGDEWYPDHFADEAVTS